MEEISSSETSGFLRAKRRYNPQSRTLYSHCSGQIISELSPIQFNKGNSISILTKGKNFTPFDIHSAYSNFFTEKLCSFKIIHCSKQEFDGKKLSFS